LRRYWQHKIDLIGGFFVKTTVKWSGDKTYQATDKNGATVKIDPTSQVKGAISPPDLLLMSLGSCKGIFFLPAAKGLGLNIEHFEITLEGEKSKHPPQLFSKIKSKFIVWGNVTKEEVKKAIDKADQKCFIAYSLNPDIEMETTIEVKEDN